MSSKKGSGIPIPLIIVGWIAFWPAGLVLTILHIVLSSENSSNQHKNTTYSNNSIQNRQMSGQQQNQYNYNYQYKQVNNQQKSSQNQDSRYSYQYQNNYQNNTFGAEANQSYNANAQPANQQAPQTTGNVSQAFNTVNPSTRKKIGKSVPAILLTICGIIMLLPTVVLTGDSIVNLFSSVPFGELVQSFITTGIFAGMTAASFFTGNIFRQRNSLYQRYMTIIGTRESVYIPKLAVVMDVKYKKAVKDLQSMIDAGYFGNEAYINMESHQLFLNAKAAPESIVAPDEPVEVFKAVPDEAAEAVDGVEGDEYKSILRQIREANKAIDDIEVSEKISRIEEITRVIFTHVEDNPAKKPKINTFMNYYLPTTLKLLKSYSQIEKLDVNTENIKSARDNIEKILDMLVNGFEQQLDQLYATDEMDISSDINVLEQMMYKDGLTSDSDFNMPEAPNAPEPPAQTKKQNEAVEDLLNSYTDDIADYFGDTGTATAQKPEDKNKSK